MIRHSVLVPILNSAHTAVCNETKPYAVFVPGSLTHSHLGLSSLNLQRSPSPVWLWRCSPLELPPILQVFKTTFKLFKGTITSSLNWNTRKSFWFCTLVEALRAVRAYGGLERRGDMWLEKTGALCDIFSSQPSFSKRVKR